MDIGNMDIVLNALSDPFVSGLSLPYQVGTAVLGQSIDVSQEMGDALVQMMEHSVTPELGGNIDLYV